MLASEQSATRRQPPRGRRVKRCESGRLPSLPASHGCKNVGMFSERALTGSMRREGLTRQAAHYWGIYIYIYIVYREREREREIYIYIYIYIQKRGLADQVRQHQTEAIFVGRGLGEGAVLHERVTSICCRHERMGSTISPTSKTPA